MKNHSYNIARIQVVSEALANLKDDVVFVGGAAVSLYADRMAEEVRPTQDVDIAVEIYSRLEYPKFEKKLKKIGFRNDTTSGFIWRYKLGEIIVDVMPVSEDVFGFSNIWYKEGFKSAIDYVIEDNYAIKIFSVPYFIASKLEAFKNRGKSDGRTSDDFEDIVFVLENRFSVWDEIKEAPQSVQKYLKEEFTKLLAIPYIEEWIDSRVSFNSPPATLFIMEKMKDFIQSEGI